MKIQTIVSLMFSIFLFANCAADEAYSTINQDTRFYVKDGVNNPNVQLASYNTKEPKATSYVTFRDPVEGSFSLLVPKGWKVEGGINRKSALAYNQYVRVISPDQQITVFIGDPQAILTYSLPNQMNSFMGAREGQWYPGMEGVCMYMQYYPGEQFARGYAQNAVGKQPGFRILKSGPEYKYSRQVQQRYAQLGFGYAGTDAQTMGGEITFSFQNNGREIRGHTSAITTLMQGMGVAMWVVDQLAGYYAPAGKEIEAGNILQKMAQSFKLDPRWEQQQNQATNQMTQASLQASRSQMQAQNNIYKTLSETSDIITDGYWERQATQDNSMRNYSNYYRGTEDVYNTNGQGYNVWDTYKYYWQGTDGTIMGTNQNSNPDPSRFTQMRKRGGQ